PEGPGPSSNTWPKCPPHVRQTTSVRRMNRLLSGRSSTASATTGSVKLGHPVPESNFVSELKSSASHPAQRYAPDASLWTRAPLNGGSVADLRKTSYWAGVSCSRHSCSDFATLGSGGLELIGT